MAEKYYIRPRKEADPRKWSGPFDVSQLKDQADRRLFSKELHEYSEDRVTWIPATQIWTTLFPKRTKTLSSSSQSLPVVSQTTASNGHVAPQPAANAAEKSKPAEETSDWYCGVSGSAKHYGPFTTSQLNELARNAQLQPDDLIWCSKMGDQWVQAQTVLDVFQQANFAGFQPNTESNAGRSPGKVPSSAVASFVLALVSTIVLVGVFVSCLFEGEFVAIGQFVSSIVLAIGSLLAVVLGHLALKMFSRQRNIQKGKWMAMTGILLGYTAIATILVYALYLSISPQKIPIKQTPKPVPIEAEDSGDPIP